MTSKIIIAGLVALAFVAGSIMTGTMADAAKGESNGLPFKQLQEQVDLLFVMIEDTAPILLLNDEIEDRVEADIHLADADITLALDREAGDADLQGQIDAHILDDQDTSDTNEIQTLSISGQTLSISEGNAVTLPQGADGFPKTYLRLSASSTDVNPDPNANSSNSAICDPGDAVLSGSVRLLSGPGLIVLTEQPLAFDENIDAWRATVVNPTTQIHTFDVLALCADLTP